MDKPQLRLTFDPGFGDQSFTMVVPLDETVARNCQHIAPLADLFPFGAHPFEEAVEVLRTREFRKDLFIAQARNLGALLVERMEDAEGWHDASRIEPAKEQLKG